MKIVFLGTGTSTGNPEIGCQCEVCTSKDPRDWRLRASILVETEGKRILIDCGPDFRWQMITNKIYSFDAVLVTHEHYDHVHRTLHLRDIKLIAVLLAGIKMWIFMRKTMSWRR